ncbi:MAG: hypothetical protein MZW92_32785 [Comamonadaceae bacterium]|nr:hypothetical protein [Comamonadaceae bacterium]
MLATLLRIRRREKNSMRVPRLTCVEIEPAGSSHRETVLWLHGLGADGHDF